MTDEQIDKQPIMSARDRAYERLKGRHSELDFDNEEQLWGAIDSDYGSYEEELSRAEEVDRSMAERFEKDPNFAQFFLDAIAGKSPVVALIERYGEDFRSYLDDPDKAEELATANKEYLGRISKEKELEEQYNSNIETSLQIADELQAEGGYTDEQIDQAFTIILDNAQKAILGAVSKEMLEQTLKGINYDTDIAEAEQIGEVKAKNTKYKERVKKASELDELPPMIDGRDSGVQSSKKTNPTISILDKMTQKPDIWADMKRGNKR